MKTSRRGAVAPFIVMEVMRAANERQKATGDVLHLEVGQPDTGAPQGVIRAAHRALDGDRLAPADGAFYLNVDIGHVSNDSEAFCRRLLADTGVACTPDVDFDTGRGRRTLRISFAGSTDDMAEAARRIERWLKAPGGVRV
ncbi:MAG: hypothetical protein EXQ87_07620 [Alphaproteobacteria bacterium]|nr:hypothetical protein [Alphaproteobacteria bacterium]